MEICYLLAFPDFDGNARQPKEKIIGLKDAPYFEPIDIDVVTIGEESVTVNEYAVSVLRQRYDGRVQMVEARYSLHNPFAATVLPDRVQIQDALQRRYSP